MKYLISFLFLGIVFPSSAQEYTITSKSIKEKVSTKFTLDTSNFSVIVQQPGKDIMTYTLDTMLIDNQVHTVLRDAENKDKIISALNCSENELNTTFRPIFSGIITLLDSLRQSGGSMDVVVSPVENTASTGSDVFTYLIGGLVGLLLGVLIARALGSSKKSQPSSLKIDEEVSNSKYVQLMDDVRRVMNISEDDVSRAGSFSSAVSAKYNAMKSAISDEKQRAKKQEDNELRYFGNLENIYGKNMQKGLQSRNFSDDRDPQRLLLRNLLPLALHYDSYIKIRQKKAQEYDNRNYKNIYDGGGELNNLEKVKFEANFVDNDPFVASIIAIMQDYDIDRLPEVNLYNKRIEK